MIKARDKGFEVQSIHKCTNYNWVKDKNKHCAILYSESLEKPVNAFVQYKKCSLDEQKLCNHYNCGVKDET